MEGKKEKGKDRERERELGISTANPLSIFKITKTFKH